LGGWDDMLRGEEGNSRERGGSSFCGNYFLRELFFEGLFFGAVIKHEYTAYPVLYAFCIIPFEIGTLLQVF
jgi:hypothetical protein